MPELCYTATQVKLVKILIVGMMSISIFQALTIRRLVKNYTRGQHRFDNLQEGASYLLDVLHANDVDLTEFDVIALTSILEGK